MKLADLYIWKKKKKKKKMSRGMTKPTRWVCSQRRLRSAWASAQSSLCAHLVAKDPRFLHADREDSDQTGRIKTLIRPGWSESSLGAHSFCWFCHIVAQISSSLVIINIVLNFNFDLCRIRNRIRIREYGFLAQGYCCRVSLDLYLFKSIYHKEYDYLKISHLRRHLHLYWYYTN